MIDVKELEHRLERLKKRRDEMESRHKGNEEKFTYHGGFDLGYTKGKIDEIENTLEIVKEYKQILRSAQVLTGKDAELFEEAMNNPKPVPNEELQRIAATYKKIVSMSPKAKAIKILAQNIANNPQDFNADSIEQSVLKIVGDNLL